MADPQWPMKMWAWQPFGRDWMASDVQQRSAPGPHVPVLVYPAAAAPQPVAHVLIDADGSETHGPLLRSLPPGEYDLYLAPTDAEAIRQDEAEMIADALIDVLAADCENGVKWLNERAAADFKKAYPHLSAAIDAIRRGADDVRSDSSVHLLVMPDFKPGDPKPEGYLQWHEWAEVQQKAGLRQKECGRCGRWKYPQELSARTIKTTGISKHGFVDIESPVCLACEAKP